MKIEKKVLNNALRILGKVVCQTSPVEVFRGVRFVGTPGKVLAMATDGVELVSLRIDAETEGSEDFFVEYRALWEMVRTARSNRIVLEGRKVEYPVLEAVPADATVAELPVEFAELLVSAAPIINRNEPRAVLRGVNLSKDGTTVTDGKQLLNLPCSLTLKESITIPFPLVLLAARLHDAGTLATWTNGNSRLFQITIGDFIWCGKAPSGNYPNWKQVISADNALDYSITFHESKQVIDFLKTVPDHEPYHGIELNVTPEGVSVIPLDYPDMHLEAIAGHAGVRPRAVLALNKHILVRMLALGYCTFRANSDGLIPVVAEGRYGRYLAMPIRSVPRKYEKSTQPKQEQKKMETTENKVVESNDPVPAASPLEELCCNVEELRRKLKHLLDESGLLIRKVKEVTLLQKQKEREFVQTCRRLERIKMAMWQPAINQTGPYGDSHPPEGELSTFPHSRTGKRTGGYITSVLPSPCRRQGCTGGA